MTDVNSPTRAADAERGVQHRMERTYEVAATPEQVWAAIATTDGIATWMVPARLDPRVGGEVKFDFGDFTSTGVITAYTPNERFAYEEPWPIDEFREHIDTINPAGDEISVGPIATEFLIESASGGSSVLRVVSSSYGTGADWEHEFFSQMAEGWIELLDRLASQLDEAA